VSRKKRRADGTLRPARRRYLARKRAARNAERDRTPERQEWLANFEPDARDRFFRLSRALHRAIWLRAFSNELGLSQEEASPLLERLANDRRWMKLRTKDGMVVGIAAPKTKARAAP